MLYNVVPLTASNIRTCASLWGDRSDYTSAELEEIVLLAARLLATDRARGVLAVDEQGRALGFGFSVFVREDVTDAYLARPHAQIGKRILRDSHLDEIVLDEHQVGRRNAGDGLDLVVINQGFNLEAFSPRDVEELAGRMIQAFFDVHRGYKLARIVNEAFGPFAVAVLEQATPPEFHHFTITTASGEILKTGCWICRRQAAELAGSLVLPLFTYSPPRVCFTSAERRLLRAALSGAPDSMTGRELKVSVAAVKARWLRLLERAEAKHPELCRRLQVVRREGTRGPQLRHIVLDYVRHHPSELTPYYPELPSTSV
jgi:hypothetical protein